MKAERGKNRQLTRIQDEHTLPRRGLFDCSSYETRLIVARLPHCSAGVSKRERPR